MLFNSLEFLLFFPVVAALYFGLRGLRERTLLLLMASWGFYMAWRPDYLVLILASTLVDFVAGRRMGGTTNPRDRVLLLSASVVVNLGLLFAFKYFAFFASTVHALTGGGIDLPLLEVLLPVGISFYNLPDAQLYNRHLPRSFGTRTGFPPVCPIRVVFPPARGRSDRAGVALAAAISTRTSVS